MSERRQHTRVEWASPGQIIVGTGKSKCFCLVNDLSNGGAKLTMVQPETLPETFYLALAPGRGSSRKCRVIWRSSNAVGVEFDQPVPGIGKSGTAKSAKEKV